MHAGKHKCGLPSGFLYCDYEECEPETFEGFTLTFNSVTLPDGTNGFKFEDPDPREAMEMALEFIHEYQRQNQLGQVVFSSTIDNFLMDAKVFDYVMDKKGVTGLKLKKGKKLGKYKGKSTEKQKISIIRRA